MSCFQQLGLSSDAVCPEACNPMTTRCVLLLQALLKKEVLNLDAVEDLLGKRPFTSATLQNIDRYRCGNTSWA